MSSFLNNTSGSFGTAGTTRDIAVSGVALGSQVEVVVDAHPYDWSYTEASITAPDGAIYTVWLNRTFSFSGARLTQSRSITYPETSDPNGTWTFFIRDTDNETSTLYSAQLNFVETDPPSEPAETVIASALTFVGEGSSVDFIPDSDVDAGSVVMLSELVGVTKSRVSAGGFGSLAVRGVFDLPKDTATNIDAGTTLYWSEISGHVVKTQSSHPLLGKSIADAPVGTSLVRVLLTQ